jgi:hypothetical protein
VSLAAVHHGNQFGFARRRARTTCGDADGYSGRDSDAHTGSPGGRADFNGVYATVGQSLEREVIEERF